MKNLVIIGVTTEGKRTTKAVTVNSSTEVVKSPSTFGFSKVSAVMTVEAFSQVTDNENEY